MNLRSFRINRCFTLVEVIVTALCLALLITPLLFIFRSGIKISRKGMVQVETILEAKKVLEQVKIDLENLIMDIDEVGASGYTEFDISSFFYKDESNPPFYIYKFYTFTKYGKIEDAVLKGSGTNFTKIFPTIVIYKVEEEKDQSNKNRNFMSYKLVREEILSNEFSSNNLPSRNTVKTLTSNLNYFKISFMKIDNVKYTTFPYFYFAINLQLVNSISNLVQSTNSQITIEDIYKAREKGVVIADFISFAVPEQLKSFSRFPTYRINWYTEVPGQLK